MVVAFEKNAPMMTLKGRGWSGGNEELANIAWSWDVLGDERLQPFLEAGNRKHLRDVAVESWRPMECIINHSILGILGVPSQQWSVVEGKRYHLHSK